MRRGLRFNRRMAWRHALRKRRIARQVYGSWHLDDRDWEYYSNLHQYSKNKIHCSCPLCSAKTRNKGRRNRKNYGLAINYKPSDLRKVVAMDMDLAEFKSENFDFSENL